MDDIGVIAALAIGGTLRQQTEALARILALSDSFAPPLRELSKEMVDMEKGLL